MMAKGYEECFEYLKNVAIDQHIDSRKREGDMAAVITAHSELLGIGLEEPVAIVVGKFNNGQAKPGMLSCQVSFPDARAKRPEFASTVP